MCVSWSCCADLNFITLTSLAYTLRRHAHLLQHCNDYFSIYTLESRQLGLPVCVLHLVSVLGFGFLHTRWFVMDPRVTITATWIAGLKERRGLRAAAPTNSGPARTAKCAGKMLGLRVFGVRCG